MRNRRSITALTIATGLALTTAACDTSDGTSGSAPSEPVASASATTDAAREHNGADAEFAQMMIVHHQGAIEMAQLAGEKATADGVRTLAQRIEAAQGPEIDLMSGWLDAWGEDQPEDAEMSGMGHEGMDMGGMDQAAAMAELEGLSGTAFDKRFLELMIEHHRGAIEMSETEIADGSSADATRLARSIIDAQTAEITEMTNLLNAL